MPLVYLDNAATTRPCEAAAAAVADALTTCWGNPSSIHDLGLAAMHRVKAARASVARALGAEPERVFFTSGGTEADNWAIFSAAQRLGKQGRHIVTTAIEHHAVLNPFHKLAQQGFEVSYLPPDEQGRITAAELEAVLRPDTILVSVMLVNNEVGTILPVQEMARVVRRRSPKALLHCDAVQGFLKVPFSARTLGADMISVSAHKIHGPKGVGALYIRPGLPLPPLLLGGGQESGMRSGTEPVPLICGFGAACEAVRPTWREDAARMAALRDQAREKLSGIPGIQFLGAAEAPQILCVSLPGVRSQGLINCLQSEDVYVSAGSACSRGHRSHVLEVMGLPPEVIDGSARVSLSRETSESDIDALAAAMARAAQKLRPA